MKKNKTYSVALKHNVFIVWKPEFNLGIPIIDEQHRGIVSTINSLHFGLQNYHTKEMLFPVIDMMYDYTHIHFKIEEYFLERIDFPNAQRHHELHLGLAAELAKMGRRSVLEKDPYKFMDFLKQWWIAHIRSEDLIFRNYVLSITDEESEESDESGEPVETAETAETAEVSEAAEAAE